MRAVVVLVFTKISGIRIKNVIFENKRRRLARAFVYVREIDIGSGLDMSSELLGFSPCFAHLEKKLYSTRHILSLF